MAMVTTDVTVGLVVNNDPAGLAKTAASILNQSWRGEMALIIVDDGSTDETALTVSRLQREHGQVQVLRNEEPQGIAVCRNHIVSTATSRYIAWADAGDLWHRRKLEIQFQTLQESKIDPAFIICNCPAVRVNRGRYETSNASAREDHHAIRALFHLIRSGCRSMLAHLDTHRQIGEFDERLDQVADEDFCIRMHLAGVHVAYPPPDSPILFVPAAQPANFSQPYRPSNIQRVWHKHKAALRQRHGWQPVAEYRRRQLLTAGQHMYVEGTRWRALSYRAKGRIIGAVTSDDPAGATFRAGRKRTAEGAKLVLRGVLASGAGRFRSCALSPDSRLYRFAIEALKTPLAAFLMRRVTGLASFTSTGIPIAQGEGRASVAPSSTERAVLALAYAKLQAREFDAAIGLVERHICDQDQFPSPLLLQRLADIHRIAGDAAKAESILRRTLERYPGNDSLRLSLADTLAQSEQWERATTCWEQIPQDLKEVVTVWTSIRIARAYRMSGNPQQAYKFLEGETRRHPPNQELEREAQFCRPDVVDWSVSLVEADAASPPPADSVKSTLTTLGFLAGGREALSGALHDTDTESPVVQLSINGFAVASTRAAPNSDPRVGKTFSLNCADLLQYLGDGDMVQMLADDKPVAVPGLGTTAVVLNGLPSRFEFLHHKVMRGYVFTKHGILQLGHTPESKRATLSFYAEVSDFIQEKAGLAVFPFYGSLLGAIRENDFISHDVGGFDMVVVCDGEEARDVKDCFTAVCRALLDAGYYLKFDPWGALIRRQRADASFLDLSYGWFNSDQAFKVSFGWRFSPARGRQTLLAHRDCRIAERVVRVPGNSEELLEQLYGPQWRVPDQGYPVQSHLQREEGYLLTRPEMQALYVSYPGQVEMRSEQANPDAMRSGLPAINAKNE